MKALVILTILLSVTHSYSQDYFTKKTAPAKIQFLFKKCNAKEVAFFSHSKYNLDVKKHNLFLVKDKSTKLWGVMSTTEWDGDEYEYLIKPNYDSIGDYSDKSSLLIFKKLEKYGVAYIDWRSNAIKPYCKFNEISIIENDYGKYTVVRKGTKWGLYQPGINFLSMPCIYNNKEDVPLYSISSYDYDNYKQLKKKYSLIGYRADGNGDGVFYACNTKQKWGMFQMDKMLIPMNFDMIEPMSFNAPFVIVYNKGKGGIYSNPFGAIKMTVKCEYDELKRFKSNGYFLCAARKNDKWAILDWYTGNLLTDFKYDSYETMTVPYGTRSAYYK